MQLSYFFLKGSFEISTLDLWENVKKSTSWNFEILKNEFWMKRRWNLISFFKHQLDSQPGYYAWGSCPKKSKVYCCHYKRLNFQVYLNLKRLVSVINSNKIINILGSTFWEVVCTNVYLFPVVYKGTEN